MFNPATGGITQRTVYIQTDAKGLELEGNLRPARCFDLAANSVKLPSYRVFNAAARFDVNRALTLHVNLDNIDNEIGLTEGNPRSGQFLSGDAGARFHLARPILGRSVRGAVTYRF